jgi:hypothetical protein
MRIPNKFSGYRFDGTRNLHDPVTLAAVASQAGGIGAAGAALGTTGAALLPTAAAATAAPAVASTLPGILPEATGILPETLGGAQGIMQGAAPALEATTQAGLAQTAAMPVDQVAAAGQNLAPVSATPTAPTPAAPAPTQPLPPAGQDVTAAGVNNSQFTNVAKSPYELEGMKMSTEFGGATTNANPMKNGFDIAMEYAQKNPLQVASGLYGAQKLGILGDENAGGQPKEKYKSSFDNKNFNPSSPFNQYAAAPNFHSKTYAEGGNVGAVEAMSNMNAVGNNSMYPMANIPRLDYANPMQQRPISQNMMTMGGDVPTDPYTGEQKFSRGGTAEEQISAYRRQLAKEEADRKAQGEALMEHAGAKVKGPGIFNYTMEQNTGRPDETAMSMFKGAAKRAGVKVAEMPKANIPQDFTYAAANGGIMHGLGGYSDYAAGGRLLKGPGDGVSDSIPAVIGNKQPARLADGEFVVPARIVSELGNGSTEAGARQLYAMMERIQKGRRKSVGKGKVAVDSKSKKHLPA